MNRVILMGRLTRDAEIRASQGENSTSIARFTLAVDRRVKKEQANNQPTADFISCVAFGRTADFFEKFGRKGTKFVVEGRIQTGSYEKDGSRVYTTDVVVENAEFAESKASAGNGSTAPSTDQPAASPAPTQAAGDGFMNIPDGIDEELPFN